MWVLNKLLRVTSGVAITRRNICQKDKMDSRALENFLGKANQLTAPININFRVRKGHAHKTLTSYFFVFAF